MVTKYGFYVSVNGMETDAADNTAEANYIIRGPDLQNILRKSYNYFTITPKLRSTYNECLIYWTSYEGRKAFLRYDSLAKV